MRTFGRFERRLSLALHRFPRVRFGSKAAYQALNYVLAGGWREPMVRLSDGLDMLDVAETFSDGEIDRASPTFFGYFDMSPWSPSGAEYLTSVQSGQYLDIYTLDVEQGGVVARRRSETWNFQQGALAQWFGAKVIFNCARDNQLGAVLDDQWLPWPVQCVHPDTSRYLTVNWGPINRWRPDYSYRGVEIRDRRIYLDEVDVEKGRSLRLVEQSEVLAAIPGLSAEALEVNHPKYAPDGGHIALMVRSYVGQLSSELLIYSRNTGTIQRVLPGAIASHYCWLDERRLLCWAFSADSGGAYFVIDATGENPVARNVDGWRVFGDGHPCREIAQRRLATDTYPDRRRRQSLILLDDSDEVFQVLATFHSPILLDPYRRCDLHPRWSRDGRRISIDSSHSGIRRNYVLCLPAL